MIKLSYRANFNILAIVYGPQPSITCIQGLPTTKAQTSLRIRKISIFFIHLLEGIIDKLATPEISIFEQVVVAEQSSFGMTYYSKAPPPPKKRISHVEVHIRPIFIKLFILRVHTLDRDSFLPGQQQMYCCSRGYRM